MEILKGDLVTRESYSHDTVFKVLNIQNGICYLKGLDVRLYADAPIGDLKKVITETDKEDYTERIKDMVVLDRDEFFYLPGRILQFDGDSDYLNRCLEFYEKAGLQAVGKTVPEGELPKCIEKYLEEVRPDILIITGHPIPLYTQKEKIG